MFNNNLHDTTKIEMSRLGSTKSTDILNRIQSVEQTIQSIKTTVSNLSHNNHYKQKNKFCKIDRSNTHNTEGASRKDMRK